MKWFILAICLLCVTAHAEYIWDDIVDASTYTSDADKSMTIVEVETSDGRIHKVCCFTKAQIKNATKVKDSVLETINKEKRK